MTTQGMSGRVEIYGVQEAMRALRAVEPALARQAVKDVKLAAEPMRAEVAGRLAGFDPPSGMDPEPEGHAKWRTAWNARGAKTVSVKYGGRRGRDRTTWPLVSVVLKGAAGSIADIAGRGSSGLTPQGAALIAALAGSPSRFLWPVAEARLSLVQTAVLRAIAKVADQANTDLAKRGGGVI